MKETNKKNEEVKEKCSKPGIQDGKYEVADSESVKEEVKELNNIGAPGKQY